ncbi:MAG: hypothetical protein IJM37_08970 [Lachnospiraceae bacterium]|nr:hypothetical protein [Lachnospiraceae bacterium]
MRNFINRFSQFMVGRYGMDALGKFLNIVSIIMLVLALITRISVFYLLGLALIGYNYFRIFSRNINKRYAENLKYLTVRNKLKYNFDRLKIRLKPRQDAKTHKVFTCPSCKQRVRVPRGRGRIEIKCPKCGTKFVKKT